MDRFIVPYHHNDNLLYHPLKSNIDRFIENKFRALKTHLLTLKSNMDRFIDEKQIKN